MSEIWKDVIGYEGIYKVSNIGRVMSVKKGLIMKPFFNYHYLQITLSKNGKRKKPTIHRLVMEAFVGISDFYIDHKDEDKLNNNINNLEYVEPRENLRRYHEGRRDLPIGVYRDKRSNGRLSVVCNFKEEIHYLGRFDSVDDAVNARIEYMEKILNRITQQS